VGYVCVSYSVYSISTMVLAQAYGLKCLSREDSTAVPSQRNHSIAISHVFGPRSTSVPSQKMSEISLENLPLIFQYRIVITNAWPMHTYTYHLACFIFRGYVDTLKRGIALKLHRWSADIFSSCKHNHYNHIHTAS
jgi:hypothetical protein